MLQYRPDPDEEPLMSDESDGDHRDSDEESEPEWPAQGEFILG